MDVDISICFRMKQLRRELGLTQAEIAEKTGIEKSSVSAYEKGTRAPAAVAAAKIAKALGVSLDYLCGINDDRYEGIIAKDVDLDISRLNFEGLRQLCLFYKFLCTQERYLEIVPPKHKNQETD